MAWRFPYTTLHEINLDWILEKVKELLSSNEEFNEKADTAVETANEAMELAEQAVAAVIPDGSITTVKLDDGAVTAAKLANDSVTASKIATGAVTALGLANNSVTEGKIVDGAVTAAKLQNSQVTLTATDPDGVMDPLNEAYINLLGGCAELRISARFVFTDSNEHTILTIPTGYRPRLPKEYLSLLLNGVVIIFRVHPNGNVGVQCFNATTSSHVNVYLYNL